MLRCHGQRVTGIVSGGTFREFTELSIQIGIAGGELQIRVGQSQEFHLYTFHFRFGRVTDHNPIAVDELGNLQIFVIDKNAVAFRRSRLSNH